MSPEASNAGADRRRLLIVHHTPSPKVDTLVEAVIEGASTPDIEGVDVNVRAALSASSADVLGAHGYVLVTPANLGYMSGGLKTFFDTIYYPCLRETQGRPYGLLVHGNDDVDGAINSVAKIVKGLGWQQVSQPVRCVGDPSSNERDAAWDLGATVAANLMTD